MVDLVRADPSRFPVVLNGITDPDPLIRMRCADVAEKVTARAPELLAPYKTRMIAMAAVEQQQEVRWHLAQILPRLALNGVERRQVLRVLVGYLKDKSSIVRTFSMQAMADLAEQELQLKSGILRELEQLTRSGSPAMKSRGRKLIERLQSIESRGSQV